MGGMSGYIGNSNWSLDDRASSIDISVIDDKASYADLSDTTTDIQYGGTVVYCLKYHFF